MANIVITDYCNLKCPYCFAEDMISSGKANSNKFISFDNFSKILNWLAQEESYQEQIGIIGGEPTLHPMFFDLMTTLNTYCLNHGTNGLLFTNGTELEKWLPHLGERINLLINCNSPKYQSTENYQKTLSAIAKAEQLGMIDTDRVRLGCNIYLGLEDYSYFWKDIVDKTTCHIVRCSVVAPGGCYMHEWRHQDKKEEYYQTLKPRFMNFVQEAKKRNIVLAMDCNQIPVCMFTEEEKQLILSICDRPPQTFCRPPIDIGMDLHATSCFGTYDIGGERDEFLITDFQNTDMLRRYLELSRNLPKAEKNIGFKCADCDLHKKYICQGGCLSFADPR